MTQEQFMWWLHGYSEICGKTPSPTQWLIIQDHLKLLFIKETPDRTTPMADVIKTVSLRHGLEATYCTKTPELGKLLPFRSCGDSEVNIFGLDGEKPPMPVLTKGVITLATSC